MLSFWVVMGLAIAAYGLFGMFREQVEEAVEDAKDDDEEYGDEYY